VTDAGAVGSALRSCAGGPPEVLLNAAAFTQVDRCEREPELAERVNALGPAALSKVCRELGVRLVHVSTDYVFDGAARIAYRETDPPAPRSVYGRTKLAGERAVLAASPDALVVRTSWVYGRGRNFVAAILAQAERVRAGEGALRVVDDQRGRPTYAADLAAGLLALVERRCSGLYHLANAGEATWWEVARAALDQRGFDDLPIQRIRTEDLALAAPRPRYSVLDCEKAGREGVRLRDWREALAAFLVSEDAPPAARPAGGG
jgi:dTDP-4-dehydrorhamnose reductase